MCENTLTCWWDYKFIHLTRADTLCYMFTPVRLGGCPVYLMVITRRMPRLSDGNDASTHLFGTIKVKMNSTSNSLCLGMEEMVLTERKIKETRKTSPITKKIPIMGVGRMNMVLRWCVTTDVKIFTPALAWIFHWKTTALRMASLNSGEFVDSEAKIQAPWTTNGCWTC